MPKNTKIPLVALIGLPNSGKSTLINRLCGKKIAITADEAHTTRDLNYGEDYWEGYYIRFVDTGGLVPDPSDKIQKLVQVKSWAAMAEADLLIWVIDRRQNPDTISQQTLQKIWKTGKPFLVAINKVDDPNTEKDVSEYAFLGGLDFVNMSANTGFGLNTLMDSIVENLAKLGFEPAPAPVTDEDDIRDNYKKGRKMKIVKQKRDGSIEIYRENTPDGPGLFQSFETDDLRTNKIDAIVFDWFGVVFKTDGAKATEVFVEKFGLNEEQAERLKLLLDKPVDGQRLNNAILDTDKFWKLLFEITGKDESFKDEFFQILTEFTEPVESTFEFIKEQKSEGKKLYYLTNISEISFEHCRKNKIFEYFDGGIASYKVGLQKPQKEIFELIKEQYNLDPETTIFIDDKVSNLKAAKALDFWTVKYSIDKVNLNSELEKIERGFVDRVAKTPKVLLLGKPNVGKSSLFNALCQEDIQIVTEIAGTTLSVNDYLVEQPKRDRKYLLLDTTGIRKPGKRTFGAESFATYKTIQAAHQTDVILLVLDASEPLAAQDQLVAGICKEAKKGIVVIANKSDLLEEEDKEKFIKDFNFKFNFLKVEKWLWISAKGWDDRRNECIKFGYTKEQIAQKMEEENPGNILSVWSAIDTALEERCRFIDRVEVRKLFNYLMKQKPPKKLHDKKRPVIYDLLYVRSEPPTFELLIKDRTSVHWSYVRFLENIIRRQFGFHNTGVILKLREINRKQVRS